MRATRQIVPSGPARFRSVFVAFGLLVCGGLLGAGCAHVPAPPQVQPWQREHLSKRAMRFDADPQEARFRQHMFGSREAGDGGYGQPGGGCGCN